MAANAERNVGSQGTLGTAQLPWQLAWATPDVDASSGTSVASSDPLGVVERLTDPLPASLTTTGIFTFDPGPNNGFGLAVLLNARSATLSVGIVGWRRLEYNRNKTLWLPGPVLSGDITTSAGARAIDATAGVELYQALNTPLGSGGIGSPAARTFYWADGFTETKNYMLGAPGTGTPYNVADTAASFLRLQVPRTEGFERFSVLCKLGTATRYALMYHMLGGPLQGA